MRPVKEASGKKKIHKKYLQSTHQTATLTHTHTCRQLSHLEMTLILGLKILMPCNPCVSSAHTHTQERKEGNTVQAFMLWSYAYVAENWIWKCHRRPWEEESESCWPLPLPAISVREQMYVHMFGACTRMACHTLPLPTPATERSPRLFFQIIFPRS